MVITFFNRKIRSFRFWYKRSDYRRWIWVSGCQMFPKNSRFVRRTLPVVSRFTATVSILSSHRCTKVAVKRIFLHLTYAVIVFTKGTSCTTTRQKQTTVTLIVVDIAPVFIVAVILVLVPPICQKFLQDNHAFLIVRVTGAHYYDLGGFGI